MEMLYVCIHICISRHMYTHISRQATCARIRIYLGGLHVHDTTMHRAVAESSYDRITV